MMGMSKKKKQPSLQQEPTRVGDKSKTLFHIQPYLSHDLAGDCGISQLCTAHLAPTCWEEHHNLATENALLI